MAEDADATDGAESVDDADATDSTGHDDAAGDVDTEAAATDSPGSDTFGVGVHVTDEELRFVVHVPSDIDAGWTDPEAFQGLVQEVVWDRLDREKTLRAVAATTPPGETATLGRVTLRPDGTVVDATLSSPDPG